MEQTCARCGLTKALDDFPLDPRRKSGRFSYCKPCKSAYMRERRTPELDFRTNLRRACRRYGITVEDYYRVLDEQGGRCAICGGTDPAHPSAARLALDHDHATGKFRALLCGPCNTGLGSFRDDIARLQSAVEYLTKHHQIGAEQWVMESPQPTTS